MNRSQNEEIVVGHLVERWHFWPGCPESIMLTHGFPGALLAHLIGVGFITSESRAIRAGGCYAATAESDTLLEGCHLAF
jgi:hypothetical protein